MIIISAPTTGVRCTEVSVGHQLPDLTNESGLMQNHFEAEGAEEQSNDFFLLPAWEADWYRKWIARIRFWRQSQLPWHNQIDCTAATGQRKRKAYCKPDFAHALSNASGGSSARGIPYKCPPSVHAVLAHHYRRMLDSDTFVPG